MQIAKVPIRRDEQGEKKFSVRVQQRADQYLIGKGLTLDQLTDFQKQRIYRYAKTRASLKWLFLIACVGVLVLIAVSIYGIRIFYFIAYELMPDSTVIELEDGAKKVVQLDRELIGTYGAMCAVFGGATVTVCYGFLSSVISFFVSMGQIRETEGIFDAFLPAVKNQIRTTSEDPT
jgi:hypothetical protein